ncbi:helix-turn-helix domain-containing protein [Fictibacillus enclensis]|uniref:helix-turn-helix domain-containing protein n=1 Tax=Fictibacillus enclensis TaxID=1017270 RepID=UPI0025A1D321|nr:helix-turn-helix domain-containing protein [Fictibacillus enclensis]MDM5198313.1 helix-turn-helix domain-containing protein [Fictibacillus enclensis]
MESEKQLMSLINAARVLTSTLDLDKVLHQLMQEVVRVIEGANSGILFIYDENRNKLVVKSGIGFDLEYLQKIALDVHEGMTGKTFSTKKGQIFRHMRDTTRAMENIQSENQNLFNKAVGAHQYPVSTICAPLLSKEGCIGVLTIDSFSEEVYFNSRDLLLLETFAAQATIAIENASLFAHQERSERIHSEMAAASLSHTGMNGINTTLSRLVQNETCVYNEHLEIAASSSDETENRGIGLRVHHREELKDVMYNLHGISARHEADGTAFYMFPIQTDTITIGILVVFAIDLDTLDQLAIDLGCSLFAREMMGQERIRTDLYNYEGYLLEQLFDQRIDMFSLPQRSLVGISEKSRFLCINLLISNDFLPFHELNRKRQVFNRLLYREVKNLHDKVLILDRNMEYDLLVIINDSRNEGQILEEFIRFFKNFNEKIQGLMTFVFHAGLGRVFGQISEIQSSHRDAKRCAQYIRSTNNDEIIFSYKDLGIYRLFLKHERDELQEFVYDMIGPLLSYDEKHDSELFKTLKTYIECNQNMTSTAKASYVHLNTIKYRLQNIRELLGKDSMEGKRIFELQMAIYMREYLASS